MNLLALSTSNLFNFLHQMRTNTSGLETLSLWHILTCCRLFLLGEIRRTCGIPSPSARFHPAAFTEHRSQGVFDCAD